MKRHYIFIFSVAFICIHINSFIFAEEHAAKTHAHSVDAAEEKGSGAIEAIKEEGEFFKLKQESEEFLQIHFAKPQIQDAKKKSFRLPSQALVSYQNEHGVYVKKDGWFHLIELKVLSNENALIVTSDELTNGSDVAISGVPLLRIAHLQASGHGGEGHAD